MKQVFLDLDIRTLYDGGTGQRFDQPATVGVIYMLEIRSHGR